MNTTDLILYKNAPHENFFGDMTWVMEHYEDDSYNKEDVKTVYFECVNELIELSAHYGLEGNLWHAYLAFVIANDENAFSIACEKTGKVNGSIWELAKMDFTVFRELFSFDLEQLDRGFGTKLGCILKNYKNTNQNGNVFNRRIRDRICELACHLADIQDEESFACCVAEFYKEFGVGSLGLHKAFRIKHNEQNEVVIEPITCTEHRTLSDLVGYERQKKKLIDNTKNFIDGKPANNVLLFGDSGTGKSSSIKAILNEYY